MADRDGSNLTNDPNPLHYWFTNLQGSHSARLGLHRQESTRSDAQLTYPNARELPRALRAFWVKRFDKKFAVCDLGPEPRMAQMLGLEVPGPPEAPQLYREPDDDTVLENMLMLHELPLAFAPLKEVQDDLIRVAEKFQRTDWST